MSSKKAVMETWFQKVWYEKNTDYIFEGFVPEKGPNDKTAHGLRKNQGLSPEDFAQFQQAFLGLITDVRILIDSSIEHGDWLVAMCTMKAISNATGEPVEMKGCVIGKIIDGIIVEAHNYFDFLHLFEGLGLLPKNTFQKCLSGSNACTA